LLEALLLFELATLLLKLLLLLLLCLGGESAKNSLKKNHLRESYLALLGATSFLLLDRQEIHSTRT